MSFFVFGPGLFMGFGESFLFFVKHAPHKSPSLGEGVFPSECFGAGLYRWDAGVTLCFQVPKIWALPRHHLA